MKWKQPFRKRRRADAAMRYSEQRDPRRFIARRRAEALIQTLHQGYMESEG
jgi:hypothetical protein